MDTGFLQMSQGLIGLFLFLLGLCIGSFLNVCICRIPENKSVVFPPSSCPKCGHALRWWENIPVISYIFLRGRCSSCNCSISLQYPVVELLTGVITLGLWLKFGLSWHLLVYLVFSYSLIVITFIDLAHKIIPDVISLPGIVVGFVSSFLLPDITWLDSLLGILVGGGTLYLVTWGYYLITRRIGMGGGDIKLLAMIGAFMGWQSIPFVIFLSAFTGSVIGILFILIKKAGRDYQIPFGPFLAAAAEIHLFWGKEITALYQSLFSFHS